MQSDRYLGPRASPFRLFKVTTGRYVQEIKRPRRNLKGLRCGLLKKLLLLTEAFFELSYTSTSIEDALLAGVERVAD